MNKAALLKKIRTLAERGVGGEAENAEKLLAHMMEKYDISEDELDADIRERNDFEYHGKEQKKILRQVVYKVTGGNAYELYYARARRPLPCACQLCEPFRVPIAPFFDYRNNAYKHNGEIPGYNSLPRLRQTADHSVRNEQCAFSWYE